MSNSICPKCQSQNSADQATCPFCGASLNEAAPPASAEQPAAPPPAKKKPEKKKPTLSRIVIVVIAALFLIFGAWQIVSTTVEWQSIRDRTGAETKNAAAIAEPEPSPSARPFPGAPADGTAMESAQNFMDALFATAAEIAAGGEQQDAIAANWEEATLMPSTQDDQISYIIMNGTNRVALVADEEGVIRIAVALFGLSEPHRIAYTAALATICVPGTNNAGNLDALSAWIGDSEQEDTTIEDSSGNYVMAATKTVDNQITAVIMAGADFDADGDYYQNVLNTIVTKFGMLGAGIDTLEWSDAANR